jgi:hypothetical protein
MKRGSSELFLATCSRNSAPRIRLANAERDPWPVATSFRPSASTLTEATLA